MSLPGRPEESAVRRVPRAMQRGVARVQEGPGPGPHG